VKREEKSSSHARFIGTSLRSEFRRAASGGSNASGGRRRDHAPSRARLIPAANPY
jgi:hypothetical protein